jgi:hypothetical protein
MGLPRTITDLSSGVSKRTTNRTRAFSKVGKALCHDNYGSYDKRPYVYLEYLEVMLLLPQAGQPTPLFSKVLSLLFFTIEICDRIVKVSCSSFFFACLPACYDAPLFSHFALQITMRGLWITDHKASKITIIILP